MSLSFDQGELLFLDWADSERLTLHLQVGKEVAISSDKSPNTWVDLEMCELFEITNKRPCTHACTHSVEILKPRVVTSSSHKLWLGCKKVRTPQVLHPT